MDLLVSDPSLAPWVSLLFDVSDTWVARRATLSEDPVGALDSPSWANAFPAAGLNLRPRLSAGGRIEAVGQIAETLLDELRERRGQRMQTGVTPNSAPAGVPRARRAWQAESPRQRSRRLTGSVPDLDHADGFALLHSR